MKNIKQILPNKELYAKSLVVLLSLAFIFGPIANTRFFSISTANAASVFSDNFGTGPDDNSIDNWDEEGNDNDSTTLARQEQVSGEDTASPDGGRFAKIANGEWICAEVNGDGGSGAGFTNFVLNYYWRGDADAEDNENGIVEYSESGNVNDCDDGDTVWSNLATHESDDGNTGVANWSSLQSVSVGATADSDFLIRFRNGANNSDEFFRVDGVAITGDVVGDPGDYQVSVDIPPTIELLTLSLTGTGSADPYVGQFSQHDVQVDWGDGNIDITSDLSFTDPDGSTSGNKTFSGTWANSHIYSTSGTYTVVVKLYHQNAPGAEGSGDSTFEFDVVIPPPTPTEDTLALCSDGQDNDTDTLVDLNDPNCSAFMPQLTVIKHVENNNGGTATAGDWTMSVTGTDVSDASFPGAENPGTTVSLMNGSYSVGESGGPSGYSASLSADCSGSMSVGDIKTCTVTNDDTGGTLVVRKQTSGWFGTFGFNISNQNESNEGLPSFDLTTDSDNNPATQSFFDVFTDIYNIAESALSGWSPISANCDNDDPVNAVSVGLGQTVTCTFVNDALPGTLTVIKNVLDEREGAPQASDFTISVSGGTPDSFPGSETGTEVSIPAGTNYLVQETDGPDGYAVDYSGACGTTMEPGGNATCTITNTPTTGSLTVRKVWIEDNGGTASEGGVTLTVSDDNDFSQEVINGESNEFGAGTYSVSESEVSGYTQSFSGDCDEDGVIEVVEGQSQECVITNDDIEPTLTVYKVVDNDPDENYPPSFFDIFVDLDQVDIEVPNGFSAGTHQITEGLAGDNSFPGGVSYTQSFGGDEACDAEGNVTLNLGDEVSCTITNTITYAACVDGEDNDDDGRTDTLDPACHTDGDPGNEDSYDPSLTDESNDPQCSDGIDNDSDGTTDFGGTGGDVSCSGPGDVNESDDKTPPVSEFDDEDKLPLEIFETELVSLNLTGVSTDDLSGVASAEIIIYRITDAEAMDGEGFFDKPNGEEGLSPFESLSCDPLPQEAIETEMVALTLTGADPLSQSWSQDWTPSRGVYCAIVHATDVAGNVENTAVAGPFAYTFTPPAPTPTPPPSGSGGGGGGGGIGNVPNTLLFGNGGGGPSTGSGSSSGGSTGGQVLGIATTGGDEDLPPGCTAYLNSYLRRGRNNDTAEVTKLQQFLNENIGSTLPVTGFFGTLTEGAVNKFQLANAAQVLKPWVPFGLRSESTPTGYVYKTTKRWINMTKCSTLNLPMPQLP